MTKIKPLELSVRTGVIGFLILLTALLGVVIKWESFYNFFIPGATVLNWRFVILLAFVSGLIVWFAMHELWRREYAAHHRTSCERDNLKNLLSISEKRRMTDVITGVPNGTQLTEDINIFFSTEEKQRDSQIILIDIKNFRRVNLRYGFLKGDQLLRLVAQEIYWAMRRNEEMYKHPGLARHEGPPWKRLYRRYPGGDEFVFLIEGDQSDAIGFVVNRLYPAFTALSSRTAEILGTEFKLSFHCAIAPLTKRDKASDALTRVEDCYMRAAEGTRDFTICWYPTDFEHNLHDQFKKSMYAKVRERFEVMNIDQRFDSSPVPK